jgi:hypothetical protein
MMMPWLKILLIFFGREEFFLPLIPCQATDGESPMEEINERLRKLEAQVKSLLRWRDSLEYVGEGWYVRKKKRIPDGILSDDSIR